MADEKPAGDGNNPASGTTDTTKPATGAQGAAGDGTKPAADGSKGAGAGDKSAAAAAAAPATYTLAPPTPANWTPADIARVEKAARAGNMTQEQAQAYLQEIDAEIALTSAEWQAETAADPDLGGANLEATQQLTKAGIDFLFPQGDAHRDGFLAFIRRGGVGNNIHVVRALARIGKAQREDGAVGSGGGGGGPQGKAPEDILYGKPTS